MACQALDRGEILSIRWAFDDPNPVAQDSIERADKDALMGLLKAKGINLANAAYEYPADYALPEAKRLRADDGFDDEVLVAHPERAYPNTDGQFLLTNVVVAASVAPTGGATASDHVGIGVSNTSDLVAGNVDSGSTDAAVASAQYYAQRAAMARLGLSMYDDESTDAAAIPTLGVSRPNGSSSSNEEVLSSTASTGVDGNGVRAGGAENSGEDDDSASEAEEEAVAAGSSTGIGWTRHRDTSTGAFYFFNSSTGESSWTEPK
jgi:hypothetical protein